LDSCGIKTSGQRVTLIYRSTRRPNDAATLVAQVIATKVADAHPKEATIERFVKARGAATVYVDYLRTFRGDRRRSLFSSRKAWSDRFRLRSSGLSSQRI